MSAENWSVLDAFSFEPATTSERLARASTPVAMLFAWLVMLTAIGMLAARRMQP